MADNSSDQTTKLPPLSNWASQTFAYGFLLDRSLSTDNSGNAAPNQSGKTGFSKPQPTDIHLLNLNPNSFSFSEPIATEIAFSQGGGKFVESRGGIIKNVSIRGTTGFLPPVAPYATQLTAQSTSVVVTDPNTLLKQTGFYEFFLLRRLFRQFMLERRQGKNITMHWLDFKSDEFWMIEPRSFSLDRGRFTYNYNIAFDCLEPSQTRISATNQGSDKFGRTASVDKGAAKLATLLSNPLSASLDSTLAQFLSRIGQLSASATLFAAEFGSGLLVVKLQAIIDAVGSVTAFFAAAASIANTVDTAPITLMKTLYGALLDMENQFSVAGSAIVATAFIPDLNEFVLEMRFLVEGAIVYYASTYGSTPGQALVSANANYTQPRATQGTNNNLFQEPAGSSGSPSVNPFIGSSGLGLVGDLGQMAATTVLRAEDVMTGETIFDVSQRLLGDAGRFIELIVLNQLQAPFIVGSPQSKPPATIAWGEKIYVPAVADSLSLTTATPAYAPVQAVSDVVQTVIASTVEVFGNNDYVQNPWRTNMWQGFTLTFTSGTNAGQSRIVVSNDTNTWTVNRAFTADAAVGDAFQLTLQIFTLRKPVSPETVAFGRDMMAVFTKTNGIVTDGLIDIMIGPLNQTQTVEGIENLWQAITLCLQSPQGSNKADPTYGTIDVVGRPFEPNNVAMYIFYVRQSLLADPRISSVEQPTVSYVGTALFFQAYIRPVRVQTTLLFRIPLS